MMVVMIMPTNKTILPSGLIWGVQACFRIRVGLEGGKKCIYLLFTENVGESVGGSAACLAASRPREKQTQTQLATF